MYKVPPASCAACGYEDDELRMIYDNYTERYFCDDHCYEDWAASNHDVLVRFYRDYNIS